MGSNDDGTRRVVKDTDGMGAVKENNERWE